MEGSGMEETGVQTLLLNMLVVVRVAGLASQLSWNTVHESVVNWLGLIAFTKLTVASGVPSVRVFAFAPMKSFATPVFQGASSSLMMKSKVDPEKGCVVALDSFRTFRIRQFATPSPTSKRIVGPDPPSVNLA